MAYATLSDLQARFPREMTDTEDARATILLEDASFWLGVWVPGLSDVVGSNTEASTAAKLLVVSMVKRELLDPAAASETAEIESEAIGPFTRTFRGFEGQRYAYDQELAEMANLIRVNRSSAVSMRSRGL